MVASLIVALVIAFIAIIVLIALLVNSKKALAKYSGIIDLEKHKVKLIYENETKQRSFDKLNEEVSTISNTIEGLKFNLSSVEEELDIQSFGVYKTHFGLETSEIYKDRISDIRSKCKALIKDGLAAVCSIEWQVSGDKAKGRKMVREQIKLMIRAFNGECDAAVSRVKYNNVKILQKRIEKSYEALNKLGKTKETCITPAYLKARIDELHLVHEHREKLQEEKEEQRRIKEEMREEQKAQREIEKAKEVAEKEEKQHQEALEKAKKELEQSTGAQYDKLEALVSKLENELSEAIDRKAKAIARAQLTKSGHVYVISNVGSFGEDVYKIGMTRRLEPLERVRELGDASVPFKYDVHAMIYSENAPALENALHKHFEDRQINKVNMRREFFRVTLDEIREAISQHHANVTFVTFPEAEEYRKSLSMTPDINMH